ncbi:hypothetical protein PZA11_007709 [Diplocarpon coronariae]
MSSPESSSAVSSPSSPSSRSSPPATPAPDAGAASDPPPSATRPDGDVLVTGGLGFIGSHTALELLKAGTSVVIVDNLSNSFPDVFGKIVTLAGRHFARVGGRCPRASFYDADYGDAAAMRAIVESHGPPAAVPSPGRRSSITAIIHLAAYKAVEESIRQPLRYYQNNVNGLVDLLSLLGEYDIKTFVFSSSAVVYGSRAEDGERGPLREEHVVHQRETYRDADGAERCAQPGSTGIASPYGRTKLFGEAILADLARADPSWHIVGLRYFNPIGCDASGLLGEDPRGAPSNLLPVVVRVLRGQQPRLAVCGRDWATPDGTAVRDFIHVTDLARGHTAALAAVRAGRVRSAYRTFNLGTGAGSSVLEVVAAMEAASHRPVPMAAAGKRAGDVPSSVAAVERARNELGWWAREPLADACRDVWNSLRLAGGADPPRVGGTPSP